MKVDRDGVIDWEKRDWETIRCPSSDTSLRISCDGRRLRFMGNIGRFQQTDNLYGLPVISAVERWAEVLTPFGLDLTLFGSVHAKGSLSEYGTTLSRVDLAGNYSVDDFRSWCAVTMQKRLGRKLPLMGRYGPAWGYEARRSNWWKAKIYDKSAELAGERGPRSGATIARFEIQLGTEYLKREGLNYVAAWKPQEGHDMGQIIYGRFSSELFRESATVETWDDLPPRLRQYAILWRDGFDVRTLFKHDSSYCRVKSQLREFGIELSQPCNVVALSRRVRQVSVLPLDALRAA